MVDTGTGLSIIRHDFAIKIGCAFQPLAPNQPKCVFVANGEALRLRHSVDLELNIEGETFVCKAVVASGLAGAVATALAGAPQISHFTLSNGLEVVVIPDHRAGDDGLVPFIL